MLHVKSLREKNAFFIKIKCEITHCLTAVLQYKNCVSVTIFTAEKGQNHTFPYLRTVLVFELCVPIFVPVTKTLSCVYNSTMSLKILELKNKKNTGDNARKCFPMYSTAAQGGWDF